MLVNGYNRFSSYYITLVDVSSMVSSMLFCFMSNTMLPAQALVMVEHSVNSTAKCEL